MLNGKNKKKNRYIISGVVLAIVLIGLLSFNSSNKKIYFLEHRSYGEKEELYANSKKDQESTIFTPYIQFAGKYFDVLDDSFTEEQNNLGDENQSLHRFLKKFEGLPGEWYVSYSYYTGVDGSEDGILTRPEWISMMDTVDFDEIKQALVSIYGNYDEYYYNPVANTNTPYTCVQWNSVENQEYSLCLMELENEGTKKVWFGNPCHEINEEDLENSCQKIARDEIEELGNTSDIGIKNYVRLNSDYVLLIATNDLGMNIADLTPVGSEYVWVEFCITEDHSSERYNLILQYVEDEWKLLGKITEKDYETPEATALAFIEAMKNRDIEQMISLFATDDYTEKCDAQAWMQYGNYNLHLDALSPLPAGNNQFAEELNTRSRRNEIIGYLRYLYQEFASGFGAGSAKINDGESGEDVLNHFWLIQNEDDIFDIEVENKFEDVKVLYEKKHENAVADYDSLITEELEKIQEYIGCDEIRPLAIHFKWKDISFLLFMEAARYEDNWLILRLGGNAFAGMGYVNINYAVPFCMFEGEEEQETFADDLANILMEITTKEQIKSGEYETNKQERRGYDSPEGAIADFFDKMKQNDLEGMLNTLDRETLLQRINTAKKIEYRKNYSDWTIASIFPICGSYADALNQEYINNTSWIKLIYLGLAGDGIDQESPWLVSDPEKFINSIEENDCSKIQYGEITERHPEGEDLTQYMDIEDMKEFSLKLTLGNHSERVIATCIYYDGKWTVYNIMQEENN